MMKKKNLLNSFQFYIALTAMKGEMTISELSSHYKVDHFLIKLWQKQLLDSLDNSVKRIGHKIAQSETINENSWNNNLGIAPESSPKGISHKKIRNVIRTSSKVCRFAKIHSGPLSIPIVALPGVYLCDTFGDNYGDSGFFANLIPEIVKGSFLEIGTGTGIVIIATILGNIKHIKRNRVKCVGVDLFPIAAKNTRINAEINNIEDLISIRVGNVFSSIDQSEKFDFIFWNHPFHQGNSNESMIMRSVYDPLYSGLKEYIELGHNYLNKNGLLLLGSGNFADISSIKKTANNLGKKLKLNKWLHLPFQMHPGMHSTYNLYEIIPIK